MVLCQGPVVEVSGWFKWREAGVRVWVYCDEVACCKLLCELCDAAKQLCWSAGTSSGVLCQ
jgi:hypothetical protein